jgi:molybdate transport system substrate-binding protein
MLIRGWAIVTALLLNAGVTVADEIRLAVASNFTSAAEAIAERFEEVSEHRVTLVFGSTAKHYTQIHNGAPFDGFLAADTRHPERLEAEGLAVPGSRFTYAIGRLVLWSPQEGRVDSAGRVLDQSDYRHLAIANPELAPYGRAAREALQALGLWEKVQGRLVRGENVGQTFQFVKSGNAELGFVALSQLTHSGQRTERGSRWLVPDSLHTPIEQQAVLVRDGLAPRELMAFIRSEESRSLIRGFGYLTP